MKYKIIAFICILFSIYACVFDVKNKKAEVLFETVDENLQHPDEAKHDTIKKAIAHFDVNTLDTAHQKAFWFNAYNFYLREIAYNGSGYLNMDQFLSSNFVIANDSMTAKQLIQKIASYEDPRLMIGLDFYTTTSSKTYGKVLKKESEQALDSLCTQLMNDQSFVRVKKDIKTVYYPEHFDWQLKILKQGIDTKGFILTYHKDQSIVNYKFQPYPFSFKLRSLNSTTL
jgi:hypothetical protein